MIQKKKKKIAYLISDKEDSYPMEIYTYGIELILSSLIGTVLVIASGIIFNLFFESIIFSLALSGIRFFSGGYHAKTYLKCNIIYFLSYFFTMIVYLLYHQYFTKYNAGTLSVLITVSILIVALFSPVENKNKKIDDDQKVKFKLLSIIILLLEGMGCYFIFNIFNFSEILVIIPTIIVVDISIVAEVIIKRHNFNIATE